MLPKRFGGLVTVSYVQMGERGHSYFGGSQRLAGLSGSASHAELSPMNEWVGTLARVQSTTSLFACLSRSACIW